MLPGERIREFVLSRSQQIAYLDACPQPLRGTALVMLETGLRIGEALSLEWQDVTLEPVNGARFGYVRIREVKTKNARRTVPLTDRASAVLNSRWNERAAPVVFPNREGKPYLVTSINHLHRRACKLAGLPADFVMHTLRHTMLTRLGESGVDAFTIMRIAGHSSITISQRYVHPTPEAVERAFERLQCANVEVISGGKLHEVPTKVPTNGTSLAVSH
jgi:integrase